MLKITFSGSCRNCFTWYLFRWPVSLSAGLHSQVVNFRDGLNLETKKEKKKNKNPVFSELKLSIHCSFDLILFLFQKWNLTDIVIRTPSFIFGDPRSLVSEDWVGKVKASNPNVSLKNDPQLACGLS